MTAITTLLFNLLYMDAFFQRKLVFMGLALTCPTISQCLKDKIITVFASESGAVTCFTFQC